MNSRPLEIDRISLLLQKLFFLPNRPLYFLLLLVCLIGGNPSAWAAAKGSGEKKVPIRSITFVGNKVTKETIIRREMNMHPGDSISTTDVEMLLEFNKRRLLNLELFSRVEYCISAWDEEGIDIEYTVNEILFWIPKPIFALADRNFNVWWVEENHRLDRTNIGLELTRLNFRGRNERIYGVAQLGYNKYFNLSYRIPYIDKAMRHGLYAGLSYATGREINFLTDSNKIQFYSNEQYPYQRFQARLGASYRKRYAAVHDLTLSYNFFAITPALYAANPDFLGHKSRLNYFELVYNYQFNNTDLRVYPTNGLDVKITASKKGLLLDRDVNQFTLYNELSYYKKLAPSISTAFVFRGRLSLNDRQPYLLNRAMGFRTEYVRGYEYYVIDGSHYALLRGNLRYKIIDRVISQNIVRFIKYIPLRVYGKIYDDLGYAYNRFPGNSFLNNRLLNGYGLGLDIVISYYAKFRIEYSFNHLRQNGLFLHGSNE